VTLARQPYRHTDYVQFETPAMVDSFIHTWRASGNQRAGYLLGRFEEVFFSFFKLLLLWLKS
jgi:nuclear protein localization family protein 4